MITYKPINDIEKIIELFDNDLINDKDVSDIAQDGETLMKIIDAIYLSAETGKEVVL